MQHPEKASEESIAQFTRDFFSYFGATVSDSPIDGQPALRVSPSTELSERFGRGDFHVGFDATLIEQGAELAATGSRLFDQMLHHLDNFGAVTFLQLPIRFGGGEELMQAIRPVNASISNLKMVEQIHHLFLFNWRIIYRADDKREELHSVLLDENGKRLYSPHDLEAVSDAAGIDGLLADALPVPTQHDENGSPLPPKLPPMTKLTELAEIARKFAIYFADTRCVHLEGEIQPRLYKSLNRLHGYYSQQIEEVYDSHDPSGDKRRMLELDLQRKLAEEVENHRLRVQIDLLSYAVLELPVAVADIVLSNGREEVKTTVRRNRYTGTLQRPKCHSCQDDLQDIALDKHGHLTCDTCLHQCTGCLELFCASCTVSGCSVCESENCEVCSLVCWACGERACHQHASQCPICFDTVCYACQDECTHCGQRQCISHLRADCVHAKDEEQVLICDACAVRCPGCQQFSAQIAVCETSGQRFCQNCLGMCIECQRVVGPSYYHVDGSNGQTYCIDCVQLCPTCMTPASTVQRCHACEKSCCATCAQYCLYCKEPFCADDATQFQSCGHIFCAEHSASCCIGHEPVCLVCNDSCPICVRHFCSDHQAMCELCRCTFCRECVRFSSNLCDGCATIMDDGSSVQMASETIAGHREVAPIIHRYRWFKANNTRYQVYLGQGPFNSGVLVLTLLDSGEELVVVRKLSAIDRYWKRY